MKLNTDKWKEFRIGDLFNSIRKTALINGFTKQEFANSEYTTPALSSVTTNNSLGFYVKEGEHNVINDICLSVTANGINTGTLFLQTKPFAIAQDAYVIYLKDNFNVLDNEQIYLFLATSVEKSLLQKYDYANKATWNKVKNEFILLPTKNNEPDWYFMEEYIKEIEEKYIKSLGKWITKRNQNFKSVVDRY